MIAALAEFQFLRPGWLLLLLPVAWVGWRLLRSADPRHGYRKEIAPHLLPHLVVAPRERPRLRPLPVLLALWILATLALAGPSWRREPAPFGEETSGLVIVVKVTRSMEAADLLPSRLETARIKVRDLLDLRRGRPTGLVAYSGSAHLVMPLTTDGEILSHMLESLEPDVLPTEGDRLSEALDLARTAIAGNPGGGSVLVVADQVAGDQVGPLEELRKDGLPGVQILATTTDPGGLADAARALDAPVERITPDDSDVRAVHRRAASAVSLLADSDSQRRDDGFLLVPVIALGLLLWGRKGWSVFVDRP